jgi:hypothetical protein
VPLRSRSRNSFSMRYLARNVKCSITYLLREKKTLRLQILLFFVPRKFYCVYLFSHLQFTAVLFSCNINLCVAELIYITAILYYNFKQDYAKKPLH